MVYTNYGTGSTAITGWTISADNVDIVSGPPYYTVPALPQFTSQYLDLVGDTNGTVSQSIATMIGQTYTLSFVYSNNPGNANAAMTVSWDGTLLPDFFHSTATPTNGDWSTFTGNFTASSANTVSTICQLQWIEQCRHLSGRRIG